jgi:hypothetical protein
MTDDEAAKMAREGISLQQADNTGVQFAQYITTTCTR